MVENGFNDLELLNQEDLIVEALHKLLRTYAELSRRENITKDLLKNLCGFSLETRVWWFLVEASGAQRFTDIHRIIGCSQTSLSDALRELLREGLVRMVENRYQAIVPAWLLQFSGVKWRKI